MGVPKSYGPTSSDVAFAHTGDVRRNSRALRQLRLLRTLGLTVTVLSFDKESSAAVPGLDVAWRFVARPSGGGPQFFWTVHRRFLYAVRGVAARIYHASDLYCLRSMRLGAQRYGGSLVYDSRELYPHVASTAGRPWVRAFWHQFERLEIRAADAVFTVCDSIADRIAHSYGIARPSVIYNVPETQSPKASGRLRSALGIDSSTVLILYQGYVQKGRGCFLLADAMRDVRGAVLVFMGGGPLRPALAHWVRDHGMSARVRLIDPVPPDELLSWTADADVGVTVWRDSCLSLRYALPNKLFEYLMAGVPVLASNLPEIRRVVERYDVGTVLPSTDRGAVVAGLQKVVDGREARLRWRANTPRVFEVYNWSVASKRFKRAYQALLLP